MKISHKILFTIALVAICNFQSYANPAMQKDTTSNHAHMYISAGVGFANFSFNGINNALSSQGLPTLNEGMVITGGNYSARLPKDHFLFEFGFGGRYRKVNDGVIQEKQQLFAIDMKFDYYVQKGRHNFYAGPGIGLMSMSVTLSQPQASPSFAQAIGSFSGERSLSSPYNFYGSLNAGYDYALDKQNTFFIGIKAMYRIGITNNDWKVGPESATYPDNPTQSARGFAGLISLTVH